MSVPKGDVPEDANQHCPGTQDEMAGKSSACEGCPNQQICATAPKGPDPDVLKVQERMETVKHKILVLSGKGGVGKSTFSAQLAYALASKDKQVGLLDIDICGPSAPKLFGLEGEEVHQSSLGWSPVYPSGLDNLGVMSVGFLLPDPDEAVVWRGPRKNSLIKQFCKDVYWGDLDFLVVDAPPGTSDEHISIVQYLQASQVDGAVIITTPQEVSIIDVRKEINFCKKVGLKVLGVVENMSGLQVPLKSLNFTKSKNGKMTDVTDQVVSKLQQISPEILELFASTNVFFPSKGGAEVMSKQLGVPFLGKIPLDPKLSLASEEGKSFFGEEATEFLNSPSLVALSNIVDLLISKLKS